MANHQSRLHSKVQIQLKGKHIVSAAILIRATVDLQGKSGDPHPVAVGACDLSPQSTYERDKYTRGGWMWAREQGQFRLKKSNFIHQFSSCSRPSNTEVFACASEKVLFDPPGDVSVTEHRWWTVRSADWRGATLKNSSGQFHGTVVLLNCARILIVGVHNWPNERW